MVELGVFFETTRGGGDAEEARCAQVSYHDTNGNTPGVLMSQELWS